MANGEDQDLLEFEREKNAPAQKKSPSRSPKKKKSTIYSPAAKVSTKGGAARDSSESG